jgi:YHS domain-containing protein
MIRTVLFLLLAILLITLLRGIVGIVGKGIASLAQPKPPARRPGDSPTHDELKRDPVCGIYVPAATAIKRTVDGETVHFCSEDCAGRYEQQASA